MTDKPKDKIYLKAVLGCLKISQERIRKDECGDYIVQGRNGKIYTVGPYWYIYYDAQTPKKWTNVKKKLTWMHLQNDGDWEGIFRADYPPSPEQAEVVRKLLVIRKSTELTDEQRAVVKNRLNPPCSEGV